MRVQLFVGINLFQLHHHQQAMDMGSGDDSEKLANDLDDKMQICTDDTPKAVEDSEAKTSTAALITEKWDDDDDDEEEDPDYEDSSTNPSESDSDAESEEDEESEWETTDDEERDTRLKEIEERAGLKPLPVGPKEIKEDAEAVATDEGASESESEDGEEKESLTSELLKESKNDDLSDDDADYVGRGA
ncbi:hypothetical protein CYLTODRAFT_445061 [Cylindrobasidium torrendii FP15055 ss-10]|uniref:Uncharacterized protein n=1 Tax=Cylindrobasidium torrendii FP15055 ss-10 TaxID=1314674 RepID=A0A0D7B6L5_9AGAR|nr:hypothetical protein CYLTODRAFT_445061 [Cylindrobasidium torrendii FP15055 ss-10]